MGLFQSIGDAIKRHLPFQGNKGIYKRSLQATIDTSLTNLKLLNAYCREASKEFKDIRRTGRGHRGIYIPEEGIEVFNNLMDQLPNSLQRNLKQNPFTTFVKYNDALYNSLRKLRSRFDSIFEGRNDLIPLEQITLSESVAYGFVTRVSIYEAWITHLTDFFTYSPTMVETTTNHVTDGDGRVIDTETETNITPEQYNVQSWRASYMFDHIQDMNDIINDVDHHDVDIVKIVEKMRKNGKDSPLQTNGRTLNDYNSENNYGRDVIVNGWKMVPNIFMMGARFSVNYQEDQLEQLTNMKNWLEAKVAVLQSHANKESDPKKAKELQKVADNYKKRYDRTQKRIDRIYAQDEEDND